jgi:hypothetical protein
VLDLREAAALEELVTIRLNGSATIDIRRSHGRVSVVRNRRPMLIPA